MDPDQDPPRRVPAPRQGGHDVGGESGGDAWYPWVPAPRGAPGIEARPARPAQASTAVVLASPRPAALAVPDAGLPGLLRTWVRAVVRAVQVTVDGVRSLLGAPTAAAASR